MNPPVSPLKIGQVHALLRQDHPELELSKIRYYEEMGLVAPARSRKGYRLYTERDVDCLREAIRLADEEFVPLRVIRIRLIEQGLLKDDHRPAAAAPRQAARASQAKVVSLPVPPALRALSVVPDVDEESSVAVTGVEDDVVTLNAAQLLDASGLDPDVLNKVLSIGLVSPVMHDGEPRYRALDVAVARCCGTLLRDGADPRVLGALRRVVEREVGIIDDLTADVRASGSGPAETTAVRLAAAGDVESLRAALFERELTEFLQL